MGPFRMMLKGIIIILLLVTGCTRKDELTRPVRVHLKVAIKTPEEPDRGGYFFFNWGHIGLQSIEFEGKREVGEDFFFESDPVMELAFIEFNEQPETVSYFDVPQGVYTHMLWNVNLKSVPTTGLTGNDIPGSGLVISAGYVYQDGSEIPVFLCVDKAEIFIFKSYNPEHNSSFGLYANKTYYVILLLDLDYAFYAISRESVENAEISTDMHGKPVIVISAYKNKELYQYLSYRISLKAEALVY